MADLTAAAILAAEDSTIKAIDVPQWGGTVHIRTMTGGERDTWEVYAQGQMAKKVVNIRAMLCAICLCDAGGQRLFKDSEAGQLANKSGSVLDKIYEAAVKLNGLTQAEVDEIEKN